MRTVLSDLLYPTRAYSIKTFWIQWVIILFSLALAELSSSPNVIGHVNDTNLSWVTGLRSTYPHVRFVLFVSSTAERTSYRAAIVLLSS